MFDKLEKLRKESENYRRRVALIISASIVGIIFLVWLSVLSVRFSASVLLFPQMILNFLVNTTNPQIVSFAERGLSVLSNSWIYGIGYFILVFVFTYFYTAVTFD